MAFALIVAMPLSAHAEMASNLQVSTDSNSMNSKSEPLVDKKAFSDEQLIKKLPGFKNGYKKVNGIKIHYVEGGKGEPLFLLPGWPQTWYAYQKIMPELAKKYHVYVVEYRGMGSSDKPMSGYDKKTMASDVYAFVKELGYDKVNMVGHDIGAMGGTKHLDKILKI